MTKIWTEERLLWMKKEVLPRNTTLAGAIQEASRKFKKPISKRQFQDQFRIKFNISPGQYLKQTPLPSPTTETPPLENPVFLRKRISELEKELKTLRATGEMTALIRSVLHGASDWKPNTPNWTKAPAKRNQIHGVPMLFISDIHHGETVFSAQVHNCNAFNIEISRRRIKKTFERATHLFHDVFQNPDYPGIICPLGGDIVSGNIHEEIRETNGMPIFQVCLDVADQLIAGITLLSKEFKQVYVPAVVGNHGRIDKKPRMKNGPADNYEYIVYHLLARHFANNSNVIIDPSESFSSTWQVYNTRMLMVHGDQFSGGGGIAGGATPWALGDHKLRKQRQSMAHLAGVSAEYDYAIWGHFHSYTPMKGFLVNGSIKGMDEFCLKKGYAFELPQQAAWLLNPTYGPTMHFPVYSEDPYVAKDTKWLTR